MPRRARPRQDWRFAAPAGVLPSHPPGRVAPLAIVLFRKEITTRGVSATGGRGPPNGMLWSVAATLADGRADRVRPHPHTVTGTVEAGRRQKGNRVDLMFDSLTVARQLTEAGIERGQADVLADAIRQAAEHGEPETPPQSEVCR